MYDEFMPGGSFTCTLCALLGVQYNGKRSLHNGKRSLHNGKRSLLYSPVLIPLSSLLYAAEGCFALKMAAEGGHWGFYRLLI